MYFKKMSGERCYLSPIELDDAPKYAAWLNDPEVTEGLVMATGYGREAMGLLIDYAYARLNLNNIMLRVYAFNVRAVRCYEALGFKKVGALREALTVNRKAHDVILMDLLPEDFYRARAR